MKRSQMTLASAHSFQSGASSQTKVITTYVLSITLIMNYDNNNNCNNNNSSTNNYNCDNNNNSKNDDDDDTNNNNNDNNNNHTNTNTNTNYTTTTTTDNNNNSSNNNKTLKTNTHNYHNNGAIHNNADHCYNQILSLTWDLHPAFLSPCLLLLLLCSLPAGSLLLITMTQQNPLVVALESLIFCVLKPRF